MRVILVTFTDELKRVFGILNPNLEYRAIVVEDPEAARETIKKLGLPESLIFPLYELKECMTNFYYDYVLCVTNYSCWDKLPKYVTECGVPQKKMLHFFDEDSRSFLLERALRYYKEHSSNFEMFATGNSHAEQGLNYKVFKHKLFNFGRAAQDLYYDYKIARFIIAQNGGGNHIKYAIIGLAPYSFHYDQSKSDGAQSFYLLQYYIAFKDLHNFWIPDKEYKNFFSEKYLSLRFPTELPITNSIEVISPDVVTKYKRMDLSTRIDERKTIDVWKDKDYPITREENVRILDDYLTLCENNKIRPIVSLIPLPQGHIKHFSRKKLDEFYHIVNSAVKKHPTASFLDGFKLQGFSDDDFADSVHLNAKGAMKFSVTLNQIIEQRDKQ